MQRKEFLKNGLFGLGTIVAIPTIVASCSKNDDSLIPIDDESATTGDCELSPSETAGPFPIKTPADLVRENIIGNRSGVPLLITLTVQEESNDCKPLADILVDIWHCDADGNYSEYGGSQCNPQTILMNTF
ncbi:hypothetical protein V5739_09785 [Salinimicrobium sp. TIG7-5_MAKvit]|uniref:hypothetical protein n=1 Tax=Salinimicrobium sp. TIG7-5_MAKvit TaxID=3121289 RepID=UPI003C6DC4F3